MTNYLVRHRLLKAGIVTALCLGCGACKRETTIHVNNRSSALLENVTLAGNGFKQSVGAIQPGGNTQAQVCPQGESGLSVSLEVNGRKLESPQTGYFECGSYVVTVEVDPSLRISTITTIK